MPRILQNLCERATGMINAGMTMNDVAINIACSTRAIRHLIGNVFKQEGVWKITHVVNVRMAKTAIFGTSTCAISFKLPQPWYT